MNPGCAASTRMVTVCRLGPVRFAVAVEDVLQLQACPPKLISLPRREGALKGAFVLRDVVVPIVSLQAWLPWPAGEAAATASPAQLMVLRRNAQWLAVGIDSIEGLRRVSADAVHRLDQGDGGDELFSSVVRLVESPQQPPGEDLALGLLDVTALLRLGKVWAQVMEADTQAAMGGTATSVLSAVSGVHQASAPARTACALLDCDGRLLAIPAEHLRAVVPMPVLQPLWGGDPNRTGVARWRERDVPVLRLVSALGLAKRTDTGATLLAILEHGHLCMGVPVDAARDIQLLDLTALQPSAALGVAPSPLLAGLLSRPGVSRPCSWTCRPW